ncbi:hypothetical protein L7F22_032284 [Adiantum nelumboides]|nr:hypothetical protein [Adiantum nelumboides]
MRANKLRRSCNYAGRRFFQSGHRNARYPLGIAFDIDGVLVRGGQPIEGAAQALRQLYADVNNPSQARIPHVFLTNGGGVPESTKASELSSLLGVKILPQQVLLGHTPFKSFKDRFEDAHILAVGKGEPRSVMTSYGYRSVVSMDDYVLHFKDIDPLAKFKHWSTNTHLEKVSNTHRMKVVDAVFVVSDPVDWGRDIQGQQTHEVGESSRPPQTEDEIFRTQLVTAVAMFTQVMQNPKFMAFLQPLPPSQSIENKKADPAKAQPQKTSQQDWTPFQSSIYVLCDVLRSGGCPGRRHGNQPPLYFAADDVEYQAAFSVERLGMGAFRIALESIFNRISKIPLVYTSFGKPKVAVFRGAENSLLKVAEVMEPHAKLFDFERLYMIGDNPSTDILGAKQAGTPWFSILTRTGCFKGKDNDELHPADVIISIGENDDQLRMCTTEEEYVPILEQAHSGQARGHFSTDKTAKAILFAGKGHLGFSKCQLLPNIIIQLTLKVDISLFLAVPLTAFFMETLYERE